MTDDLKERLARKTQVLPAQGGGAIAADGSATCYVTDDGYRLINPDGPEALARITALEAALERLIRRHAAALEALEFAHEEGFDWPADPFGEAALAFADPSIVPEYTTLNQRNPDNG